MLRLLILFAVTAALALPAPDRILVHGHRGARAMRPENTLPAFQYAIDAGVDFLELDMAVTKDNVIVISHDPMINPQICDGPTLGIPIHTLTLAELRQYDCGSKRNPRFPTQVPVPGTRIPTLDEVFDLGRDGTVQFNIETKSSPEHPELTPPPDTFARMVLEVVRRHHVEKRVILQSFDFRTLHAMKALDPSIPRAALFEKGGADFVQIARDAEAPILSPEYHLVTPERVKAAHEAGLSVVPWTANDPAVWAALADAKVDAIITDNPAALIAWLAEQTKKEGPSRK